MNTTTDGNTSLLLLDENSFNNNVAMIPNVISPIIRLPVNVYVLQLILSKQWITSEFYAFCEAFVEVIICIFDILGVVEHIFHSAHLVMTQRFFLGFVVTGRPILLTVICIERYLAVVKPVVFLRFKPLKYKLVLSGIILLWTLVTCSGTVSMPRPFYISVVLQTIAFCGVKLYCCIATLLVLKKPGPGEGVRQKEGMNKIKLKAFRMILIITFSVIVLYVPMVLVILIKDFFEKHQFLLIVNGCYIGTALSGFVHALLFLKRCGKLSSLKWPKQRSSSVKPP